MKSYVVGKLDNRTSQVNNLLVVSGSRPAVTSNCCTLNPPVLPPIPPEGGLALLTLQAHYPKLKPPVCGAGVKAALPSHGADQFDEKDPKEAKEMSTFFNWLLLAMVGPLSGEDPLVIVIADTDHLPHTCCGSILSACVLRHPGRCQLISGLSGSSYVLLCWAWAQVCIVRMKPVNATRLRFRDSSTSSEAICFLLLLRLFASFAAICFFRGYLLLSRLFASSTAICFFRDISLYLLGETYIKSVLTQKGLDTFCHKYHIPNDVHPQLPSPNQTIHEMPTGKIGVYTIFFEYAKFRLPLSNFLVNVLRHYRINLSQFSVITATKVSYFEILCCVHSIEPTVWYKDPTKVKVGEKERTKGEAKLLDSTVGRVVPLLPVSPAHAESELEASVDRLFDEGGSADQGDSAAGGGQDAETELVMRVKIINAENVIAERPRRPRKKWQAVTDASGSSHPPKKLKGDHRSLLALSAVPHPLPLVTSFVSAMPERESGAPTNSIIGLNLRSIGPFESFVISSDSSHHFSTNTTEAGIDSFIRSVAPPSVMTKVVITTNIASIPSVPALETGTKVISPVHAAMFHDSDSTGTVRPDAASSSHVPRKELLMGSQEINS
ncbi:gypsy type transposase [Tanacetum coccineum]